MKYHYKSTQHKATFLTIVCFVLFVAYSVFMYLKHQSGIVALTYFIESDLEVSLVSYSAAWISALLGTFLCIIPAMVLLGWFHFPLRLKAVAFLPSYIILGFLTGISPETVTSTENEIPIIPFVVMLNLSIIFIYLSQVFHENRGEHAPTPNYLGPNVFISCLGMLLCVFLTNSDRHLHVQLSMAESIHKNDFAAVEKLPSGETTSNNTITSMQVYTLSKKGQLADRLFSLPYLKGSCSLLPDTVPSVLVFHTPSIIYGHLRAVPVRSHQSASAFLEKAVSRRSTLLSDTLATREDSVLSMPLMDYFLCALLLDRELNRFVVELPKHYNPGEPLPVHYSEALALCEAMEKSIAPFAQDTVYSNKYEKYQELKLMHKDNIAVQRKACVYAFPDTYWNYYFFGTKN